MASLSPWNRCSARHFRLSLSQLEAVPESPGSSKRMGDGISGSLKAPDFKARQLTQFQDDDGQDLTQLTFTHDGRWVIFVRGGNENQSGEIPNPTSDPRGTRQTIFAASFDDGRDTSACRRPRPSSFAGWRSDCLLKGRATRVVSIAEGSEPHPLFAVGEIMDRRRGRLTADYWLCQSAEAHRAISPSLIQRKRVFATFHLLLTAIRLPDGRPMERLWHLSDSRRECTSAPSGR